MTTVKNITLIAGQWLIIINACMCLFVSEYIDDCMSLLFLHVDILVVPAVSKDVSTPAHHGKLITVETLYI